MKDQKTLEGIFVGQVSSNRVNVADGLSADYVAFINILYKYSKHRKFVSSKQDEERQGTSKTRHIVDLPECKNFTFMVKEYLIDETDPEASIVMLDLTRKSMERNSMISSGSNKVKI